MGEPLGLHPLGDEHTIRLVKQILGLDHAEDPLPGCGRSLDLADRQPPTPSGGWPARDAGPTR